MQQSNGDRATRAHRTLLLYMYCLRMAYDKPLVVGVGCPKEALPLARVFWVLQMSCSMCATATCT